MTTIPSTAPPATSSCSRACAVAALAALGLISVSLPARAGLTVYHDRAAFEAAATDPLFTEDFESYERDVLLSVAPAPLFGGAVLLSSQDFHHTQAIDLPPYVFDPLEAGGRNGIDDPAFGENFVSASAGNVGDALLRIELPTITGGAHRVGFDYSGAGGDISLITHYKNINPVEASGTVTAVDGNTVTGDADLSGLTGSTYIMAITSGTRANTVQKITSWAGMDLTTPDDLSAELAVGDSFELRASLTPDSGLALSCRVTTVGGGVEVVPWPVDPIEEGGWQVDDGFIGFHDPENRIVSIELLNLAASIYPPENWFHRHASQVYAIDHLTTSLPDGDLDGLPDFYEQAHGLDQGIDDSGLDADSDGLTNLEEFQRNTNPKSTDTDHDCFPDFMEVSDGSDPTDGNDPVVSDLWVDFGIESISSTELYQNYNLDTPVGEEFPTVEFGAFGTKVSLTPSYPDSSAAGSQAMLGSNPFTGADYFSDAYNWTFEPAQPLVFPIAWFALQGSQLLYDQGELFLLSDFLAIDTQAGSGGNGDYDGTTGSPTRLALRLGGLPEGSYTWRSFHHDIDFLHTEFLVEVSTDGGTTFLETGQNRMTHSRDGGDPFSDEIRWGPKVESLPSRVDFGFDADGVNEVVVRFTPLAADGRDTRIFGINGFQLSQTEAVEVLVPAPLEITKVEPVPDSGSAIVSWRSTVGQSYTLEAASDISPNSWEVLASGIPANSGGNETCHLHRFPGGIVAQTWIVRVREEP